MLRRRELVLGMGIAALGACAPRPSDPAVSTASGEVPEGAAAHWPPSKRSVGWVRGQVTMAPDFDAPLDDFMIDIDNDVSKCATPGPAGARGGMAG